MYCQKSRLAVGKCINIIRISIAIDFKIETKTKDWLCHVPEERIRGLGYQVDIETKTKDCLCHVPEERIRGLGYQVDIETKTKDCLCHVPVG